MKCNLSCTVVSVAKPFVNAAGSNQQFITVKSVDTNELFSVTAFDSQFQEIQQIKEKIEPIILELKISGGSYGRMIVNYLNIVSISKI